MKKFLLEVNCINTRHYALTYEIEAETEEQAKEFVSESLPSNEDLYSEDNTFDVLSIEEIKK